MNTRRLRSFFGGSRATSRELTTSEVEEIVLAVLADGQARTVFQIKRDAESAGGITLSGSTLNLVIARLADQNRLLSAFDGGGRRYRLPETE